MNETIDICTLRLKEHLHHGQAPLLRGAVIAKLGQDDHPLFHNHTKSGLRYGYPLVQYKSIDGNAAIVGIGDAVADVQALASWFPCELQLGLQQIPMHIDSCLTRPYQPTFDLQPKLYSLSDYIPLNDKNIKRYRRMLALTDKITFIEDILTANILAFLKGIGYHAQEQISCAITQLKEPAQHSYKQVPFETFYLQFVSNIELPDDIGLGKGGSVGFGTLKRLPLPWQFMDFVN